MFADLHLHTHFSDGTYSPEELAGHAHRLGFSTIALTDHDTVEGCARMGVACAAHSIDFIPATELTAEIDGDEVHLLGMFLNTTHPRLLGETAKYQKVRTDRIYEMVTRLNKHGVPLEAEVVFKLASCQSPGRPHVARALVQEGVCRNMDEAFDRFLKKHRVAWVPKFKVSAADAIALIHEAGGLAVLAHPGLNRNDSSIPKLLESGLDGLECFHSKHGDAASQHYLAIAEKYKLLVTGGSDCHGMSKGKPLIGTIKLPLSYVHAMKEKLAARGASSVVA